MAVVTGTDLSTGSRVEFSQTNFDLPCSNLDKVRFARAAASSSAVPLLLSPVTLNNYGGTCGFSHERYYFMNLPTSFTLPPETIDRLRQMAGRLLAESPDYQLLLQDWREP